MCGTGVPKRWYLSLWLTFHLRRLLPESLHHSSLATLSTLTETIRFHLVPLLASVFYTSSQAGLRGGAERKGKVS